MNLKKVENILIIAFLLLNILLLWNVYNRNVNTQTEPNSESIDVIQAMEEADIELPEFNNEVNTLPNMQADNHTLLEDNASELDNQTGAINESGALYSSILTSPIELSEGEELTENDITRIREFMDQGGVLYGEEYEFYYYNPSARQVYFVQTVNGIPVLDGTSTVVFNLDSRYDVISYEQRYAGPLQRQGQNLNLITDQEAVEILYQNNQVASGATVTAPILSYYRTLRLEEISVYIPVWTVRIISESDSTTLFVDAAKGNVITQFPPHPGEEDTSTS